MIGQGHAAIQLNYETKLANTEQLIKKQRNIKHIIAEILNDPLVDPGN